MNNQKVESMFPKRTWALIAAIGIIGLVFLVGNHTSYALSVVPYLILLLCPLMHLFMHKNHGRHDDGRHHDHNKKEQKPLGTNYHEQF